MSHIYCAGMSRRKKMRERKRTVHPDLWNETAEREKWRRGNETWVEMKKCPIGECPGWRNEMKYETNEQREKSE